MKVIKEFQGVPEGEVYPKTYAPGDECPPELLEAALALEAVEPEPIQSAEPAQQNEPATPTEAAAAAAPENKAVPAAKEKKAAK